MVLAPRPFTIRPYAHTNRKLPPQSLGTRPASSNALPQTSSAPPPRPAPPPATTVISARPGPAEAPDPMNRAHRGRARAARRDPLPASSPCCDEPSSRRSRSPAAPRDCGLHARRLHPTQLRTTGLLTGERRRSRRAGAMLPHHEFRMLHSRPIAENSVLFRLTEPIARCW